MKIVDPNLPSDNDYIMKGKKEDCKKFLALMRADLKTFPKAFNYILK